MKETITILLNVARKSYMGADFTQAFQYAQEAKSLASGRDWLECQKVLISSFRELERADEIQKIRSELTEYLRTVFFEFKSPVHYLLAQIYSYENEWAVAQGHIEGALESALKNQNKEDVCYALFGLARISVYQGHFSRALGELQKLDLILQSHPKVEIEISVSILKADIYRRLSKFDLAIEQSWSCYEASKAAGYHVFTPIVLSLLSALHIDKKQYDDAHFFLRLANRGVSREKQPALHRYLCSHGQRLEALSPKNRVDLVVDESSRVIYEKHKGAVDFKNQHTLLELALLFLRNPQKVFSKEELLAQVWSLSYEPGAHDNLIYVTIKRLRTLLEPHPESPKYILRNRQGYYFEKTNTLQFKNQERLLCEI